MTGAEFWKQIEGIVEASELVLIEAAAERGVHVGCEQCRTDWWIRPGDLSDSACYACPTACNSTAVLADARPLIRALLDAEEASDRVPQPEQRN